VFTKLRHLFADLMIYGMGDVATTLVGFLLLYFFTIVLTTADYGVLALLLTVELVMKIAFRWGVDASFMRLYYDCPDQPARQRLASTIFFFLLLVNGTILTLALAVSPLISSHLFGPGSYALPLQVVFINTFIASFYFIPFHAMRIQGRPLQFSALTFSRSAATILFRVVLVLGLRAGVLGMVLADLIVTVGFTPVLIRWFAPLIRPVFSRDLLRQALRFGLPRVPHAVAQQVAGPGTDAYLLLEFLGEPEAVAKGHIGIYSLGASFGLGLKLFLSAFEYAWAPFYFSTMKEPDAKRTFSGITTYSLGILFLLAAGLSAMAPDLVRMIRNHAFYPAAAVIPWVAIGVTLQGFYLLTSIGLNITKRTEFYPIATTLAAITDVGANLILIPRYGYIGAAWSGVMAYAVLAITAFVFSQRFYPIRYEWTRIARLLVAALAAYALGRYGVPPLRASVGLFVRGMTVVVAFPTLLAATGFFRAAELARARQLVRRFLPGAPRKAPLPEAKNDYAVAAMEATVVTGDRDEDGRGA
jgi:O-antigen/teichoic acid export membrane protein